MVELTYFRCGFYSVSGLCDYYQYAAANSIATYETWFRSIKEVIVACGAGIRSFPQKRGVNMLYAILKLTFVNAFAIPLLMFFRSHFEQWRLGCPLVERVIGVMLNVAYFIIEIGSFFKILINANFTRKSWFIH